MYLFSAIPEDMRDRSQNNAKSVIAATSNNNKTKNHDHKKYSTSLDVYIKNIAVHENVFRI